MEKNHLKLLLIDDTSSHRPSLGAVIREVLPGTLLMTAGNSTIGLKLAEAEDPDMILLNSAMSDRDGINICRRLKTDGRLHHQGEPMERNHLKLLLIDDTPSHRPSLGAVIREVLPGILLMTARNGTIGLRLAETEDPDVILLNFAMSDRDGIDICRRLKTDNRLRDIPVICLTDCHTDPETRIQVLEIGADGFLSLPLDPTELIAQVRVMSRLAGRLQRLEKEHLAGLVAKRIRLLEQELAERKRTEDALRKSEEQYRLIAENMSDIISVLDINLKFIYISPSKKRLHGITVEEAIKQSLEEVMTPESLQKTQKVFEEEMLLEASGTADPGRTRIMELEHYKHDGATTWMEVACSFLRNRNRKPVGIICVSRDISERKQAEKSLRESEKQYRMLFQNANEGILITRGHRTYMANPALLKILGYPDSVVATRPFVEFLHPDDQNMVLDLHTRRLKGESVKTKYSFRAIAGDGTEKWIEIHSSIIAWKGVPAVLSFLMDITDRRQAEAERERLMAAIEQAGEVVVITNPDGVIQYVNPAFEEVTGYKREEAIGQNPRILKSGRQDVIFYQQLWETVTSGRTWSGSFINKRKDGVLYTEDATISPVCDAAGRIINYVAVKRDITEHLRLSAQLQQAQKMESVGRLAGGVAHDFYNMLSVILGYTELAMEKVDRNDPLHADLEEVSKAASRSTNITRQLLAFARQQIILPRTLDLNASIEGMLKMLRRLIGEDITLSWLPAPDLWPVRMDPSQIDQILANLCINARDSITDVGKILIQTSNTVYDGAGAMSQDGEIASGEFVLLTVTDDGCGMDQATVDKIFEPFFTTKAVGQGTGLGLATVYGIIKQNNGFINVNSEPGKGTAFNIYLPRHSADDLNHPSDLNEQAIDVPKGQGEIVLVVDDEFAILLLVKKMLESVGYHALTADTPAEALRLAEGYAGEIHLLMTDVIMPEMNGRVLAERIQSPYPNLKCLYMSGYTGSIISRHGMMEHGVHFIQKPFSLKELAIKIREVLNG